MSERYSVFKPSEKVIGLLDAVAKLAALRLEEIPVHLRDEHFRAGHRWPCECTRGPDWIVRAPQGHPSTQWRAVQVRRVGN